MSTYSHIYQQHLFSVHSGAYGFSRHIRITEHLLGKICILPLSIVSADCALARASSHTLSLQEDLDVKEQINANLKLALEEKTKQLEGFRSFLLEVEGLLLSGTQRSLCFSTGRTPGDPPSVSTHAAQGAGWTSEDEFSLLMRQSENGLRQLTQRLQQYEEDFEDVRAQLEALESERDEHRSHAYELERCLHASRVEMTQMKEVAADREALRAVVEEQKRELEEQRRQLVGLQQRCVTLESKSAAAQSPSRSRSTGRGDTAASLASTVEPYTWRGSGSDRGRGASAGVSPGDTSILKGSFFGRDPSDLSRRPVIVGRTDDLDDFAVAFTVADGLGENAAAFRNGFLWTPKIASMARGSSPCGCVAAVAVVGDEEGILLAALGLHASSSNVFREEIVL
ncbi:FYVE zinc finger domain-containing protein [Toxoplasma gondii FOU]|uniref:FYVE zinc finger domain-containing protein n=1 Tax=Toxoplasma gondii FOU TaxID=943167 RepID=A0A086JIW4_TOXGO|nr:FYVE zinc finger domain-containing protein [Toxoplasma gondii FOU]